MHMHQAAGTDCFCRSKSGFCPHIISIPVLVGACAASLAILESDLVGCWRFIFRGKRLYVPVRSV